MPLGAPQQALPSLPPGGAYPFQMQMANSMPYKSMNVSVPAFPQQGQRLDSGAPWGPYPRNSMPAASLPPLPVGPAAVGQSSAAPKGRPQVTDQTGDTSEVTGTTMESSGGGSSSDPSNLGSSSDEEQATGAQPTEKTGKVRAKKKKSEVTRVGIPQK
uniref:Uncharacterized protein n=1 Tax=Pinguiococcus pyrenoidosus TaxID=172671 RepID=A0A7R9U3U7_9STRA